jgi:tetratricopeptide (TPR) repeat protein
VRFVDGHWVVPDPDRVDVPEGVRDVVGQRLSRLSEPANEVLRAAAVLGREFDVDLAGALAGVDEDVLLDALDDANRARLVEETGVDQFRFTHALVRTTLYEELSASRRRRMHRRVVDLLAERNTADLAALAHHSVEAGPRDGSLRQAIGYVLAAGERAQTARAHGEAETYFEKAIELIDEDDQPGESLVRIDALVRLGETQRDQGEPAFRETLLDAARRAISADDAELLTRAALANTRGFASIVGDIDTERVEILEAALQRAASVSVGDQARLLATLATELVFDPDSRDRRLAMADRAIEIATESGDPELVAWVVTASRMVVSVPERWTQNVALAHAAVAAADATGDPTLRLSARNTLASEHLSCADITSAASCVDEAWQLVDEGAGPFTVLYLRAIACQFVAYQGRFDEALAGNDRVLDFGEQIGVADVLSWWAATRFGVAALRGMQGGTREELAEVVAAQQTFADQYPGAVSWRSGHIETLAISGRLDECRSALDRYGLRDPTWVPRDLFWLNTMFALAAAARILRDADLGRALTTLLEPFDGAGIHYGLMLTGTVEICRARAAAAQALLDDAVVHARNELEWARGHSPVFTASASIELAEFLIERDNPGDHDEARSLLAVAQPEARRMDMTGWLHRADAALSDVR